MNREELRELLWPSELEDQADEKMHEDLKKNKRKDWY